MSNRYIDIVRNITPDININVHYHATNTKSIVDYVMIFTPRSGSTWLTSILSGYFGYPEEYINPELVKNVSISMGTKDPENLIETLRKVRKSENGVFGIQVRSIDIKLFGRKIFFRAFKNAKYFNVRRRNIVAQAISLYRATETGVFHSTEVGEKIVDPGNVDEEKIIFWMKHIMAIEQENDWILRSRNFPCVDLVYEDIAGNTRLALELVQNHLGIEKNIDFNLIKSEATRKLGDKWNEEVEARIRQSKRHQIAELMASRPISFN